MKKLLQIVLFFPQIAFAQIDFTKIYHPIINEAELAIVDDNHAEALSLYKEAFSFVEKPFAKDYYNAAICAVYTNRLFLAFDYLEKIVEKGYPADSLRKDIFFKNLADTCKRWDAFEKQMKLIKPNLNYELKDSLLSIFKMSFKDIPTKLPNELHEFYKTKKILFPKDSMVVFEEMPDSLKSIYYNTKKLQYLKYQNWYYHQLKKTISLINIYGFPDENLIGLTNYAFSRDTKNGELKTLIQEKSAAKLSSMEIMDIFIHNSINDHKDTTEIRKEIRKVVYDAVREGKLLPRHARSIFKEEITINQPYHSDNLSVFQMKFDGDFSCNLLKEKDQKWFWKRIPSPNFTIQEINEQRSNLGLANLEDTYRKTFYKITYPKSPFLLSNSGYRQEIIYVASCDSAEKIINQSEELR